MSLWVTFSTVAIMLLYAVPAFILIKTKLIKKEAIPAFAVFLMYVCQPCLTVYSFSKATFSWELFKAMAIFFGFTIVIMVAFLVAFYFIFRNRMENVKYRIATIATCFGNVGFLGVPLLEKLLPDQPNAAVFSTLFMLTMNLIGWTVGSTIITGDKKYISVKKILLNPAILAMLVALPIFFTGFQIPVLLNDAFTVVAKMTAPLCMSILGMRLATVELKPLFCDWHLYAVVVCKQIAFPLVGMLLIWFLPIDMYIRQTAVILCACPVASVVLNFAEMLGEGQETAANLVLLGTVSSILTMPVVLLLI